MSDRSNKQSNGAQTLQSSARREQRQRLRGNWSMGACVAPDDAPDDAPECSTGTHQALEPDDIPLQGAHQALEPDDIPHQGGPRPRCLPGCSPGCSPGAHHGTSRRRRRGPHFKSTPPSTEGRPHWRGSPGASHCDPLPNQSGAVHAPQSDRRDAAPRHRWSQGNHHTAPLDVQGVRLEVGASARSNGSTELKGPPGADGPHWRGSPSASHCDPVPNQSPLGYPEELHALQTAAIRLPGRSPGHAPSLNMGSLGTKPVEKAHKALLSTFAEEVSKGAVEAAHLKLAAEVAGDKLFCTQRTWLCQTCVYIHTTYIYIYAIFHQRYLLLMASRGYL